MSSLAFVTLTIVGTALSGSGAARIYLLSFWHYYLYWLAYYFGAVPLRTFKRDAVMMKTVSLIALASVYLCQPLDLLSPAVVAAGFLLNVTAARTLGSDRTYYGHEIADLPRQHISAFPYSWISHPMLLGNIVAFGGTMLNAGFRQEWWPLAATHVALNLCLLAMELTVRPLRLGTRAPQVGKSGSARCKRTKTALQLIAAGAVLGGAAQWWGTRSGSPLLGACIGAGVFSYTYVLYCCYSAPAFEPGQQRRHQAEDRS